MKYHNTGRTRTLLFVALALGVMGVASAGAPGIGQAQLAPITAHAVTAVQPAAIVGILGGADFNDTTDLNNVDAGETIAFNYTVVNQGSAPLTDIAVTDSLLQTVTCPAATLAVGAAMNCTESAVYTITAGDAATGSVADTMTVTAMGGGKNLTASNTVAIVDGGGGILQVSALDSPTFFQDNDGNSYPSADDVLRNHLIIKNSGSVALTSVNLTVSAGAPLLDGPIACNATTLGGTAFGALNTAASALAVGDSVLCTGDYTIKLADVGTALGFAFDAVGNTTTSSTSGGASSLYTVQVAPAITITKTLFSESGTQDGKAEPGETLTYHITLSNAGGASAPNYSITDVFDPNTTYVTGSASNGGTLSGGSVVWNNLLVPGKTVAGNGSLVLTVAVKVADPIPAGVTQVANLAYDTTQLPPPCPPAGNQCVVTPTAPPPPVTPSVPAPVNGWLAMLLLGLGLLAVGVEVTRRKQRHS